MNFTGGLVSQGAVASRVSQDITLDREANISVWNTLYCYVLINAFEKQSFWGNSILTICQFNVWISEKTCKYSTDHQPGVASLQTATEEVHVVKYLYIEATFKSHGKD